MARPHSLGNFINLPYSLALQHQQYHCYLNAVDLPDTVDSMEVGPGSHVFIHPYNVFTHPCNILNFSVREHCCYRGTWNWKQYICCISVCVTSCTLYRVTSSYRTPWVKTNGHEYKKDAGLIYEVQHDLPIMGKIEDIYIVNGSKVLFNIKSHLTQYQPHFQSYLRIT